MPENPATQTDWVLLPTVKVCVAVVTAACAYQSCPHWVWLFWGVVSCTAVHVLPELSVKLPAAPLLVTSATRKFAPDMLTGADVLVVQTEPTNVV